MTSARRYKLAHPDRVKASKRKWDRKQREQNPARAMIASAKCRDKKAGVEFLLRARDVVVPLTCPVLGIPLFAGSRSKRDNSPSLDRFNPAAGYVPGNVRVISNRANQIKSNATAEEIRAVLKYMEGSNVG